MKDRPIGVTIVAILTIVFGVALLFLFILLLLLSAVGWPHPSGTSAQLPLIFYVPLILSVSAFAVSSGILGGARRAWYASMVFWMVFALFFVWCYSFMGVWRWMFYLESGDWYKLLSARGGIKSYSAGALRSDMKSLFGPSPPDP